MLWSHHALRIHITLTRQGRLDGEDKEMSITRNDLNRGDCSHHQASQRITKDGDHQLQSFPPHLDGTSIHTSDWWSDWRQDHGLQPPARVVEITPDHPTWTALGPGSWWLKNRSDGHFANDIQRQHQRTSVKTESENRKSQLWSWRFSKFRRCRQAARLVETTARLTRWYQLCACWQGHNVRWLDWRLRWSVVFQSASDLTSYSLCQSLPTGIGVIAHCQISKTIQGWSLW